MTSVEEHSKKNNADTADSRASSEPLDRSIQSSISDSVESPSAYISSASGSSPATPQRQIEKRMTIDRPSVESMPKKHPPQGGAYPFQVYDSDGSAEGSIVYSFSGGTPPPPSYDFPNRLGHHERLSSFDSLASTGSFRILTTPQSTSYANQPPPVAHPPRPQLLPYDQRRKLAEKRQEQQQQQQPQQRHQPQQPPPPPQQSQQIHRQPPYSQQQYPMTMPIPHQHYHSPGPPPPYPVSPYGYPHPNQRQMHYVDPYYQTSPYHHPYSVASQTPQHHYQPQPQPQPQPQTQPQQLPPRGYRTSKQSPKTEKSNNSKRKQQQQQQQPPYGYAQYQIPPPPPPPHHALPPSGQNRHSRSRSYSADSQQSPDRKRRIATSTATPPPPPSYHIRADSAGSISSLGSSGGGQQMDTLTDRLGNDIAGFLEEENETRLHEDAPDSSKTKKRPLSIEEFHQRNQAFLQKTAKVRNSPSVSQQRTHSGRSRIRKLPSIEDDEWGENARNSMRTYEGSALSSEDFTEVSDPDENTSLLPPPGISTHESRKKKNRGAPPNQLIGRGEDPTMRFDNRTSARVTDEAERAWKKERRKKKKKSRSRRQRHRDESDDSNFSDSDESSNFDYRQWTKKRAKMLEKERIKLIAQWKADAQAEAAAAREHEEKNRWYRRLALYTEERFTTYLNKVFRFFALLETFICNLPLTIGAVALAIVTLGVVWFKFAEENLDSCSPVHFHSSQCTFPEFPGCFYCDSSAKMYQVAVYFHFACSIIAGVLAMSFVLKMILATRVVLDEMSSPTTASPAGLICMTTVCVFAGRGWVGQMLVSVASAMHLCLAIWFIYMALAYHIMPEPSWFPNTVGIGLSAVKTWLYFPMCGHLLMAISLSLNFFFFPISLIRVTINKKISAPVGWIQMSAPAISLYALTIMAQPSFEEEHPDVTKFQRVHRMVYLPCMHFLFVLAVIGVASSVQSMVVRWNEFKKKPFSPAHAAFCFPTLAHANAIQAYRGAVNSFSGMPPGSPFKLALYTYWVIVLVAGTIGTAYLTAKFFYMLPAWTQIDVADEEEPPAPYETTLTLQDVITTGETLRQPFVSPAVLQANETGALVMLPRGADGRNRYVRTRRLPSLGFEPTMKWSEMNHEREVLLDWVGRNPPRRRKRTLSVPGVDFNYGYGDFGFGNSGVYGSTGHRSHARGYSYQPGDALYPLS